MYYEQTDSRQLVIKNQRKNTFKKLARYPQNYCIFSRWAEVLNRDSPK